MSVEICPDLAASFGEGFIERCLRNWRPAPSAGAPPRSARSHPGDRPDRTRLDALVADGWPRAVLEFAASPDMDMTVEPTAFMDAWVPRSRPLVALVGGTRIGKSHAVARWALRTSGGCTFVRAGAFARTARRAVELEQLLRADTLVLDDLGLEVLDAAGYVRAALEEVVDTFIGERKVLVVTSNVAGVDVEQRYGARVAGRWREFGTWHEFGGAPALKQNVPTRQERLLP